MINKKYRILLLNSLGLHDISNDVKFISEVVFMHRNRDFSPVFDDLKISVTNYDPLKYEKNAKILVDEAGVQKYAGYIETTEPDKIKKLEKISIVNIIKSYRNHTVDELEGNYDPAYISNYPTNYTYKHISGTGTPIEIIRVKSEGLIKAIFESNFEGMNLTCQVDFSNYQVGVGPLSEYLFDTKQINTLGVEEHDEDYIFVPSKFTVYDLLLQLAKKIGFIVELENTDIIITKYGTTSYLNDKIEFNNDTNQEFVGDSVNKRRPRLAVVKQDAPVGQVSYAISKYSKSPLTYYGGIQLKLSTVRRSRASDKAWPSYSFGVANKVYVEFEQPHYLETTLFSLDKIRFSDGSPDYIVGIDCFYDGSVNIGQPAPDDSFYIVSSTAIVLIIDYVHNNFSAIANGMPILPAIEDHNDQILHDLDNDVTFIGNLLLFRENTNYQNTTHNYRYPYIHGFHIQHNNKWNNSIVKDLISLDNTETLESKSFIKKSLKLSLKKREYVIEQEKIEV